jgi:microcystin-dependent protein
MPGNYSHTNRATGTVLTANIYNTDHQNHIDNDTPSMMDDYSANTTQMQSVIDPGESGSESLATSLAGEIERLRFAILEIKQTMGVSNPSYWYETKDELDAAKLNIANATKGDLITRGASAFGRKAAGADGTVLTADSTQPDGLRWSVVSLPPLGTPLPFGGHTLPPDYLWCDGSAISRTIYSDLFAALVKSATVTVDASTDKIIWSGHGLRDYWPVKFSNSGGSLPGGIASGVTYWIRDAATNDFKISETPDGPAIDISSAGSGTHTAVFAPWGDGDGSTTFNLPALMGRTLVGYGAATLSETLGAIDTGADTILVAANTNKWITGMPVVFTTTGSAPGGLVANGTYYVIRINSTTIRLAASLANAQVGAAINITSLGSGTHTITHTLSARGLGEVGGEEAHAMTNTEMLIHNHSLQTYDFNGIGGPNPASSLETHTAANTYNYIGYSGGNAAMNIMQPWVGISWIIRYK